MWPSSAFGLSEDGVEDALYDGQTIFAAVNRHLKALPESPERDRFKAPEKAKARSALGGFQ